MVQKLKHRTWTAWLKTVFGFDGELAAGIVLIGSCSGGVASNLMASGLAVDVLQSHVAALPPNIFGTWMNISGSMLANYWIQKPAGQPDLKVQTKSEVVTP